MARQWFTAVDLNKNELRQAVLHLLGTDPSSPAEGQLWYNSTDHVPKFFDGTDPIDLTNPVLFNSHNGAYYLDRANHTGSQAASTISDFDTQVRISRLDQMAAAGADVSLGGFKITSLAAGTTSGDAVNLGQLQAAVQGFSWKDSARVAPDTNTDISSPGASLDGVSMSAGDRVLLKSQTAGGEKGIYVWNGAAVAMTRALDADTAAELENASVFVDEGTNAGTAWNMTTEIVTLGTTAQTWVQFGAGSSYTFNAPLSISGNTVSLDLSSRLVVNGSDELDLAIVDLEFGGLGVDASDDAGKLTARGNLVVPGIYTALIGDGSSLTYSITQATHKLRSDGAMIPCVLNATTGALIECEVTIDPANGTVTFGFFPAPATNAYRIVIHG